MRVCITLLLTVSLWGAAVPGTVRAEDASTFMGTTLDDEPGLFLAAKTANLRDQPDNKGKVLGKIEKGERVQVAGRAKGTAWLAVTAIGDEAPGEKGFSYAPVFLPLIDGTLDEPLTVKAALPGGPTCAAEVVFVGKTLVEEDMFDISDYEAHFRCDDKGKDLTFIAYMFLTEAPFDLGQKARYQINVDLREVGNLYDEPFSSVFIYDRDGGTITFDGLTLKGYLRALDEKVREAPGASEAIAAAVEMAPLTWNEKVWAALRVGGETPPQ